MASPVTYSQIIRQILIEHTRIPYAHGDIEFQTVFDDENQHYLLMLVGREGTRRVHGCLIHLDIINDKIWIQRDGTEDGVADNLLDAGVQKNQIVLGFQPPDIRPYTEFAAA